MVYKSQIKAKDNYEKNNPLKATYWNRKSGAKSFIYPKSGTKLESAINENIDLYIKDLTEMKIDIDKLLNELKRQQLKAIFLFFKNKY